jgi:hypothetical protein
LRKKAEGWLREAIHILNLAQCVSTDPKVKSGLYKYASELLVSAIKLDTDSDDVPQVLVEVTSDLSAERLRLHGQGVMRLATAPGATLAAKYKQPMIMCAKELFSAALRKAPSDKVARGELEAATKAAVQALEQRRSESPYNTRAAAAAAAASLVLKEGSGKENAAPPRASAASKPGGCCARPDKSPRVGGGLVRTESGTLVTKLDLENREIRAAARSLTVHYSLGLTNGKLHFTRSTKAPVPVEDLCRLVCKNQLTAAAAVLCGSRWVPLSQLIDLSEARRIGAAAMRRGSLDIVRNESFAELTDTLATEIAQRLPRYPIKLHVYDLGQAKGISGPNVVTKGLAMGGMFHGAIEVHGDEWSFGWADPGYTGVFDCPPTQNELHRHRETVELGWTWLGPSQTAVLTKKLQREWGGDTYDFLRKNCCHFCEEFATRLEPGLSARNIPPWLNRLARGGASVADTTVSKWLFAEKNAAA